MCHELRAPLASVLFFIKQVQAFLASLQLSVTLQVELKKQKNCLAITTRQIILMQTFVDDLLDFRQIKDGVFTLAKKAFCPAESFQLVCDVFRPQTKIKRVKIGWKVMQASLMSQAPKSMPKLVGDERRLLQVLINLVRNAIKFTNSGRIDILVDYSIEKSILEVHVQDTGVGIAQEDIPRLFSKYAKLQDTAQLNGQGIGLGLTIVKQIVELSGGGVSVKSDGPGKGSTFSFSMVMSA